jgi:MinD-like ATPase involved in chromosome partitioning or flagellar assembly
MCLLDLGAGLSRPTLAIARRSNTVLLALDSDRVTLAQAGRVMGSLNEGGLTPAVLKLVWVNRQGLPEDVGRVAIQSALGIELSAVIGSAPEAMYQALEHNQPLVVGRPDHPVALQFRTLAASLA